MQNNKAPQYTYPITWKKSIAPFMYPAFLFVFLMLHIIYAGSFARSAFFLLALTVIFSIAAYFLYDNEKLVLHEDRLEYRYGIWNPDTVMLEFGKTEFAIMLPAKTHLLQKIFRYRNLAITDKNGRGLILLRGIRNADEFYKTFSDTVNHYLQSIDPGYQVIPEIDTRNEAGYLEEKAISILNHNKSEH